VARAREWTSEARDLALDGGQARQARRLEERAALLHRAEQEVAAAAYLKEPEWALEGLLVLGQGYEDLYDALLASPPPRGLDEEGRLRYREAVRDRARVLLAKAWKHYDEGVNVAARVGWVGRPLPDLEAARDAIDLSVVAAPEPAPEAVPPAPEPAPEAVPPAPEPVSPGS
jgi:hypothetical protein